MAAEYDDTFTHTVIGRTMRAAVWRRTDALFAPGAKVLELNCGTGVDALHLMDRGVSVLATDAAQGMVDVARSRGVDAVRCDAEDIGSVGAMRGPFDGALSNFGGLNCVADMERVAAGLGSSVRPGGAVLLCVMGPVVPWEWAWYLGHRQGRKAVRRFKDSTEWRGLTIRYPSVGSLRTTFAPWFACERAWALGAFVPPSYVEPFAAKHQGLVERLDRIERRTETWWPVVRAADHYVLELRRR